MASNKYGQNLANKTTEFWKALNSLEAYIGVVISPTKTARTQHELEKLVHFIYWVAPEPGMTFEESVYFLQSSISAIPRPIRKKYQRDARSKLLSLDWRELRAVVYGCGQEAVEYSAFYKSWDWRTLRMKILRERGPRCQCCGATTKDFDAVGNPVKIVVDHIKPIRKHWDLRLDSDNLQVLCDECNQGKGAWDETDWRQT